MNTHPYHAFLLRLWLLEDGTLGHWAASLEHPHSHEIRYFSDLTALVGYLHALTGVPASQESVFPPQNSQRIDP